jgi:CheY-like chemotaxis protein
VTVILPPQPVWLEGDKTRLAQVLLNLLNNAAKYTNPGGTIHVSASVETSAANSPQLLLRVRDNGLGIPKENISQIFELFARLERDAGQDGLGIGLHLVKRIVEMHDGTIEAHSAGLEQGSEFTLCLPLIHSKPRPDQTDTALPESARPEPKVAVTSDSGSKHVLVVDDYEPNRSTIARLLELMGHKVTTAQGGRDALDKLESIQPDIALLDLNMPGMNGYELAQTIKSMPAYKNLTLVALTGYGGPDELGRTTAAGFNYHFIKPVDGKQLEDILSMKV